MKRIILFDGLCNFCDSSVQFIIKRDPKGYFKFASLQSETGQKYINQYGIANDLSSMVLIEGEKIYIKSTAALKICGKLKGLWRLFTIFRLIPVSIRDSIYNLIAANRYKWFGKKDNCMIPTPEVRARFLE